jgi:DNA-binding transcriptional MerR regulator
VGYRISELAERSGFSPSTLRYYETIGLLPEPDRTDGNYRIYDDDALERLAFISRAKTMGLALDDITELVTLWSDGPCAPVQERLQTLLDAKVAEVNAQLADLSRFALQLAHLRRSVAVFEPADRCGPACGCDIALPVEPAIACTLSAAEAVDRSTAWNTVLARVTEREMTDRGVRARLPDDPELIARTSELCVREVECCAFFSFALTVDTSGVWLDVAAPNDARDVLDRLFLSPEGRAAARSGAATHCRTG